MGVNNLACQAIMTVEKDCISFDFPYCQSCSRYENRCTYLSDNPSRESLNDNFAHFYL